jgi:ferredoxin-nitrite reductase
MKHDSGFSETQKQYLAGLVYGVDVARAVRGLPVLSQSLPPAASAAVALGPNGVQVDGQPLPAGPDRMAHEAQQRCEAAGGKLVPEEIAKRGKNGIDTWDDIARRSAEGVFPKGGDLFLTKFHGLFHVAPAQDAYMCRLRLPGGVLQSWQMNGLADLAERCAGGFVDVTTRANLQLREIPAAKGIDVLNGLRELDIINLGAGADNIRNVTCSTLSGLDPTELIETLPLARRMHHYILAHRELYGLPRKFNIAFEGGGRITSLEDTNDIGFTAVTVSSPVSSLASAAALANATANATGNATGNAPHAAIQPGIYFLLQLGGITGHHDFARATDVLVTAEEAVPLAAAIVRVFIQHGDRSDRKRARLKYLLDAWGFEKFLQAVEAEWGQPLRRVAPQAYTIQRSEERLAHVGFHKQKQSGLQYVGVVLPVGRIQAEQMRGLARIASRYGSGQLRLTVWQNLILPDIADQDVPAVSDAIRALGLDYAPTNPQAGLVACTGNAGCKYAAADTKRHALLIADRLRAYRIDSPINVHLTGCHHSCAQHYIGDIGLIACKVEQEDDLVEGYHLHVGGGWGERQGIARQLLPSLTVADVLRCVENLVSHFLQLRDAGEEFVQFVRRTPDDELRQLCLTAAEHLEPSEAAA